jgi:hypothetical protein
MKPRKTYLILLALIIWVSFVGWGWMALSRYENTPGPADAPRQQWPEITSIHRVAGLPTLVIFLHPHCPCSRASVAQLSKIITHAHDKVRVQAVFVKLPELSENVEETNLYKNALRIPGVQVMIDEGGVEAKNFKARVSGQVVLYDGSGQLVFNGGITSSRGHEGDNVGQDAIIGFLTKGVITRRETPFFGCFLFNESTQKS